MKQKSQSVPQESLKMRLVQQIIGVQFSNSITFSKSAFHKTTLETDLDPGVLQKPVVPYFHLLLQISRSIVHFDLYNSIGKFSREKVAYVRMW
jgi:hypothetical protein